jgi:hypothetical protein
MWGVRILSGSQAGQIVALHPGKNRLGRAPSCEVKIASTSVSKEHAEILNVDGKLIVTDLNSRNGTFVNGVRIQNQRINVGDKISLHEILLDVVAIPASAQASTQFLNSNSPAVMRANAGGFAPPAAGAFATPAAPAWAGNLAMKLDPQYHAAAAHEIHPHGPGSLHAHSDAALDLHAQAQNHSSREWQQDPLSRANRYIDEVAMPGIYAIVRALPFRWALGLFITVLITIITALSIVPMMTTTKHNIQAESIRRAKTIARVMRDNNKRFIAEHNEAAMDVRSAELEEGVVAAFIINAKDGTVMAPANKRGEFANKPFVNQARREDREFADFVDGSSELGVSVPIMFYNSETGSQSIAAYAVVLYDTGAMAMPAEQTLGLFIQTLAISLVAGGIFFLFLYRIIEAPLTAVHAQLDGALREGRDDIKTEYQFPVLEQLVSNINSALSRIGQNDAASSAMAPIANRDIEAANIVRMLRVPAIAINAIDERIIISNLDFENLIGGGINLAGRPITDIPDIALQQNLLDLLPKMRSNSAEIAYGSIPFAGENFELSGQAVLGSTEIQYFLVTLNSSGGG